MKQRNEFKTEEEYIEYLKLPKPFFSYDPRGEFDLHATAEEAEAAAKSALDYHEQAAADSGWDDGVTDVCWGELRGEVVRTKTVKREDAEIDDDGYDKKNDILWNDEWDEIWYHQLLPTVAPMQTALQNLLGAYPMSSNPAQTRAKIEAYKALGWKEGEKGLLIDPSKESNATVIEPFKGLSVMLFNELLNESPELNLTPSEVYDFVINRYGESEKDELDAALVAAESKKNTEDQRIEIIGPQFFEDHEPCGYCERPIGEKHRNWCRQ